MNSSPRAAGADGDGGGLEIDYGADDRACVAMLLWMVLKLNPKTDIDIGLS